MLKVQEPKKDLQVHTKMINTLVCTLVENEKELLAY